MIDPRVRGGHGWHSPCCARTPCIVMSHTRRLEDWVPANVPSHDPEARSRRARPPPPLASRWAEIRRWCAPAGVRDAGRFLQRRGCAGAAGEGGRARFACPVGCRRARSATGPKCALCRGCGALRPLYGRVPPHPPWPTAVATAGAPPATDPLCVSDAGSAPRPARNPPHQRLIAAHREAKGGTSIAADPGRQPFTTARPRRRPTTRRPR